MRTAAPRNAQADKVAFLLELSPKLHAELKAAAKENRETMRSFIREAIQARIDALRVNNLDSPFFVPLGLRPQPKDNRR